MNVSERWFRPLAIITASLLVTSLASIGQVRHEQNAASSLLRTETPANDGATPSAIPADAADTPSDPGVVGEAAPVAGISGSSGSTPATVKGGPKSAGPKSAGATTVAPSAAPTTAPPPPFGPTFVTGSAIPDFGLRTQGVTAKEVKIGVSYNVAACGDAGTLEAAFGASTTGDPKKAIDAFTRHVNETGGIGGRTLKVVIVDDGGGGCPEKASAAAVKMLEEEKVFLAIPGLHVESDYLIEHKLPVFGGRDDPAAIARSGANGIMLTEAIEPTLEKWSAFGRYYLDSGARTPCLIHPESGASGDWNSHEKLMVAKFKKYGLTFKDIITYQEDVSTAQTQANTIAARAKANGCDQVYFMAGNPIALVFFTQAMGLPAMKYTWSHPLAFARAAMVLAWVWAVETSSW